VGFELTALVVIDTDYEGSNEWDLYSIEFAVGEKAYDLNILNI
jgi:hypothetical protein